jgi:putative Holliday junction resolvase
MARIGRRIAFDYGDVRIGVAICDPDGILATPHGILLSKDPKLMSLILELIQEFEPVKFYIGLPVHLSGTDSEATRKAREFGDSLTSKFDIPCEYIDERLSTVSAAKNLAQAGISAKDAKDKIDAMAAVEILEQGLRKVRTEL